MADLRTGKYGEYYGSPYTASGTLTRTQMQVNAKYIYKYLTAKGWTRNAIAGILGNMEHESGLNPGRWQSDNVGGMSSGYSLVQWTPASNYISWAQSSDKDPSEMDTALDRIIYELNNGLQYYKTDDYPLNFTQFSKSTESAYYLACAFAFNYERSWVALYGTEAEKEALRQRRGSSAETWYDYLATVDGGGSEPSEPGTGGGSEPSEPSEPESGGGSTTLLKRKKMSLLLLLIATRRK